MSGAARVAYDPQTLRCTATYAGRTWTETSEGTDGQSIHAACAKALEGVGIPARIEDGYLTFDISPLQVAWDSASRRVMTGEAP